jgi:hypothetical protein
VGHVVVVPTSGRSWFRTGWASVDVAFALVTCGESNERFEFGTTRVNQPGEVLEIGETWTVLRGVAEEPDVVWLREPNGDDHAWDNETVFEWFERVV